MPPLLDVCVLVAAHRGDHPHHRAALAIVDGDCADGFAYCAHTRNGFLRLVTHAKLFPEPTPLRLALAAWQSWIDRPQAQALLDSTTAQKRFADLCQRFGAAGNAIYDYYLAAMALSAGTALWSFDTDFAAITALNFRQLPTTESA